MDKSNNTLDSNGDALKKIKDMGSDVFGKIQKSGFIDHIKEDIDVFKNAGKSFRNTMDKDFDNKKNKMWEGYRDSHIEAGNPKEAAMQMADESMKAEKAALDLGKKEKSLGRVGESLLEDLGRGNKMAGGAKLGGYMLGTAMLADLLNPFGD